MISSINVSGSRLTGDVSLSDAFKITENNDLNISADIGALYDNKWTRYMQSIASCNSLPYVTDIANVGPDDWNMVWLLGGRTTQVDVSDGNIEICDMAQTVDYPRIYKSVYAMLRQLRLWIDANKDSLLLYQPDALKQWDSMVSDIEDNKWDTKDLESLYMETRSRDDIDTIGPATSMINEYAGTVALWNHIVGLPESAVSVRLHPADSAGIYVGIDVIVPMDAHTETKLDVSVSISVEGQSGEGLHTWLRVPTASITPAGSISPSVSIPGISGITSKEPSILDNGNTIEGTSASIDISATIPEDKIRSKHILQCVVEAIPFFLCSDNEKTYPDSKKADHFLELGENVWDIQVDVYKDGELIQHLSETKKSTYATVCDDPDASESTSITVS